MGFIEGQPGYFLHHSLNGVREGTLRPEETIKGHFGWDSIDFHTASVFLALVRGQPATSLIDTLKPELMSTVGQVDDKNFISWYKHLLPDSNARKPLEQTIKNHGNGLSPTEYATAILAIRDKTYQEITRTLIRGKSPVASWLNSAMEKLGAVNRVQLAAVALETGLITPQAASTMPETAKIPHLSRLTQHQINLLKLVSQGLSNQEIGRQLNISPITARNYLTHIYLMLECETGRTKHSRIRASLIFNLNRNRTTTI